MPSINIENGKRIEDLLEINNFTNSAHFLVSGQEKQLYLIFVICLMEILL